MAPIDAGCVGQCLLRQAALQPRPADSRTELAQATIAVGLDRLTRHPFLVASTGLTGHGIYDLFPRPFAEDYLAME
jgi:hypothetical protein